MAADKRAARLGVLALVATLLFGAIGARLWFLQTVQAESLQQTVDARKTKTVRLLPERGRIVDTDGRILADNERVLTVSVDWDVIQRDTDRAELFTRLSGWLEMPVDEMEERYDSERYSRYKPMPVKENVKESVAIAINERIEDFPGVSIVEDWRRVYPYAPLGAPRPRLHGRDHRRGPGALRRARLRHVGRRRTRRIRRAAPAPASASSSPRSPRPRTTVTQPSRFLAELGVTVEKVEGRPAPPAVAGGPGERAAPHRRRPRHQPRPCGPPRAPSGPTRRRRGPRPGPRADGRPVVLVGHPLGHPVGAAASVTRTAGAGVGLASSRPSRSVRPGGSSPARPAARRRPTSPPTSARWCTRSPSGSRSAGPAARRRRPLMVPRRRGVGPAAVPHALGRGPRARPDPGRARPLPRVAPRATPAPLVGDGGALRRP